MDFVTFLIGCAAAPVFLVSAQSPCRDVRVGWLAEICRVRWSQTHLWAVLAVIHRRVVSRISVLQDSQSARRPSVIPPGKQSAVPSFTWPHVATATLCHSLAMFSASTMPCLAVEKHADFVWPLRETDALHPRPPMKITPSLCFALKRDMNSVSTVSCLALAFVSTSAIFCKTTSLLVGLLAGALVGWLASCVMHAGPHRTCWSSGRGSVAAGASWVATSR